MKFIEGSVLKKYSVLLPYLGGALSLLILVIQAAMDGQMIPIEYHVVITSLVIPGLAHLGRKIRQSSESDEDQSEQG